MTTRTTQWLCGSTVALAALHCSLYSKSMDLTLLKMVSTHLRQILNHGTKGLTFSILKVLLELDSPMPLLRMTGIKTTCLNLKTPLLLSKTGSKTGLSILPMIFIYQERVMEASMFPISHGKSISGTRELLLEPT